MAIKKVISGAWQPAVGQTKNNADGSHLEVDSGENQWRWTISGACSGDLEPEKHLEDSEDWIQKTWYLKHTLQIQNQMTWNQVGCQETWEKKQTLETQDLEHT